MIRKVKWIVKCPDYEIIFLLDANKIPVRELLHEIAWKFNEKSSYIMWYKTESSKGL